ncbi:MFS transporter [Rhodospirillaceae bacterium SYSU D60014]|uniref:MFS transporter n=1 Tax=Virgifigura deserti TaxID=2268457 RepID=UPI000E66335E
MRAEAGSPGPLALASWCVFDWANSAFPTVITTFLFSAYFIGYVADDPVTGTALWGQMASLAGLAIAIASPVLGGIADQGGRRKPWLAMFGLLSVLATAALWFVRPEPEDVVFALVVAGIATFAFELASVFYNAMLPDLVPNDRLGRLSGWGWGLGYAGGLACLVLGLLIFVQPEQAPFGLDKDTAEHVRAVAPLVAVWFAVFALPLFLFTPDRPGTAMPPALAVRNGLSSLAHTLRQLPRHRNVAKFLIAKMIYIDGLNTLFAFGGIYAAGSFGMSLQEVMVFGILLNVTAGLGAALFAWVDDWIGAKPTIVIALIAMSALGAAILLVESKAAFYAFGLGIGIFVGPTQAASRSLMARLAPPDLRTEFFGLYAFAGKATAFLGPAVLGWATFAFDSQRAGMATILPFFVVGLLLLLSVREPRSD